MSEARAIPIDETIREAQRVLAICNACRYCEGFCAVFPALERRLAFPEIDVHYLANLCHNCGSCLYACQYAPPHEFRLDFPRALAQVRRETYREYAWPSFLGLAFQRNGAVTAGVLALCFAALLLLFAWNAGVADAAMPPVLQRTFYAVLPHAVMAGTFGAVFIFSMLACAMSFRRFVTAMRREDERGADGDALSDAAIDAATLRYLGGGGAGCTYPREQPSRLRQVFHHLTFYGFALCFASTVFATFYHYALGEAAPYPFVSVPVVLGTVGGLALATGTAGLTALMIRRDPALADPRQAGLDIAFVLLLFAIAVTGLLLLAMRDTSSMPALLLVHLALVLALFVTLPYGKLVHALYRFAALIHFHRERRRPAPAIAGE